MLIYILIADILKFVSICIHIYSYLESWICQIMVV